MNERITATVEDYLCVIYILERDGEPVAGVRLAELLDVTPPTVTNTLKRMVRDGLIYMDAEHVPHLAEQGLQAAQTVLRRHMLVEWMLSRMVSWSNVHREAHEMEHVISSEVEAALFAELNNPEVCPHGNPLPGHEDLAAGWLPLVQAEPGSALIIRRIHEFAEEDHAIITFLEEKKIVPGKRVTIKEVLPFNQTVTIEVEGEAVSLGFAVARYIFGEPVKVTA